MTTIAKQSFEELNDSWDISSLSSPPCTLADDTWNYHTALGEIFPSDGNRFWGIQDLNGNCGSSNFESIELPYLDISTFRNVFLTFEVYVVGYDNGDDMKYQLWLDDEAQNEVLFIDGSDNYNTNGWQIITIQIPNSTSNIKLNLSVKQNGSDIAGIDNITVQGEPLISCSELMISEYVEGTSSTTHRNNYIELYNPTPNTIDLSSYQLIKFTGKKLNPSATLHLEGSLDPLKTYLIEDSQEQLDINADLSTNSSVMNFNGDDKIGLKLDEKIIDIIGIIGDSTDFAKDLTLQRKSFVESPNDQFNYDEWEVLDLEQIGNLKTHTSSCQGQIPEIEVLSNGRIITDGSNKTTLTNNTYFGAIPLALDSLIIRSFTIKNKGTLNLEIIDIKISGVHQADFVISPITTNSIIPNDSLSLTLSFQPSRMGINTAKVEILNNDASENLFDFIIQAEATGPSNHPLMISQYYEGNGNNKWIEITNTGPEPLAENSYFLALFWNADTQNPIGIKPSRKKLIPSINSGQSILFRATLNVSEPSYALNDDTIKTTVCGFTGDDIIIISTSGEENCWEDKIDIIGKPDLWGANKSMVRKYGCEKEGANTGFKMDDWIIQSISDVDQAHSGTNKYLGEYYAGPAVWLNDQWQNGSPDLYREAIIGDDFSTSLYGNFEACSLTISGDKTFTVSNGTHISIQNDLKVIGTLEVENQGAVIMINDNGLVENEGEINLHKSTTQLKPYDYTYWSSPVNNSTLEEVFSDSPQNSFYAFSTPNYKDLDGDGHDDNNDAWVPVSGTMEAGRGYTSMAPDTTPFIDQQHVVFSGLLNNGKINTPIELQTGDSSSFNDWNLIGNPYPSVLDAEILLTHPENQGILNGTLYFWTHNTSLKKDPLTGANYYSSNDYAMYTIGIGGIKANSQGQLPSKYIASGQGFFVEAEQSGILTFDNSMRSKNRNNTFFKGHYPKNQYNDVKIWLNLYNDLGAFSQILIGFSQGATQKFDKNYDGIRLNANEYLSFFSILDDLQLAIQGTAPFQGNETFAIGLENQIEEPTLLYIEIDSLSENISQKSIYLKDHLLNKIHDITQVPYAFELTTQGLIKDRFTIQFHNEFLDNSEISTEKTQLIWYKQNEYLNVKTSTNNEIATLQIYDLNGRTIKELKVKSRHVIINWQGFPSRAIYLLRVKLKNSKVLVSKMILR